MIWVITNEDYEPIISVDSEDLALDWLSQNGEAFEMYYYWEVPFAHNVYQTGPVAKKKYNAPDYAWWMR